MEQITEKQKQLYEEQVKKRTPVRKLFPQIRVVVWHREQEILEEYKPEIAQR